MNWNDHVDKRYYIEPRRTGIRRICHVFHRNYLITYVIEGNMEGGKEGKKEGREEGRKDRSDGKTRKRM